MNITSWNVNSVRKRQEALLTWIAQRAPDVVCLQELKCQDDEFPRAPLERLGYSVHTSGQKSYNGVAILSRLPVQDVERDLPWPGDAQARGIAATVGGPGAGIRVVNLYVPNGNEVGSDKYAYKLEWLDRLIAWAAPLAAQESVICGDFNIAPADADTWDAAKWRGQLLCTEAERARLQSLCAHGFSDGLRRLYPARQAFTWWDYRNNGFLSGQGLRIDHHLVSAPLWPAVLEVSVDEAVRAQSEASDHAPVTLHLRRPSAGAIRVEAAPKPEVAPEPEPPASGTQIRLFGG